MKKYFKNNILNICFICILTIFSSVCLSLSALIIGSFLENITQLDKTKIVMYSLTFVINVCFILLFEYLRKIAYQKIYRKFMLDVKNDLFVKIFNLNYTDYYSNNTEEYINILTSDVRNLYNDYFDTIISTIVTLITIIIYFIVVTYLNWVMAIAIIVTALISLLIPKLTGAKLSSKRKFQSSCNAKYLGRLKDLLSGYSLKNNTTNDKMILEHNSVNAIKENATYDYEKYNSYVEIFGGLSLYIMNIVVFIVGIILIYLNYLEGHELVVLISFTDLLVIPIGDFIYQLINIKSSKEIKNKIVNYLNYSSESNYVLNEFKEKIEINNVLLNNGGLSLEVPHLEFVKGKKYAIIGPSGCGKSTLLKLIKGNYRDYQGEVVIDEKTINSLDMSKIIAEINQDDYLFNTTVRNNITLFDSYKNDITQYAKLLNVDGLMDRTIDEARGNVSGGEKKKISILRALCRGCEVLIFDEVLSNLDEENKKEINEFITNLKNVTLILVTHDVSYEYLKKFDEIIVMNKGGIRRVIDSSELKENINLYEYLWE